MRELHDEKRGAFPPTFCIFRGMSMLIDDVKQLEASVGKLVIRKSFLSATIDQAVARIYAGDGHTTHPHVSVLFQMEIDTTLDDSKPFAVIGQHSSIGDESEVILSMGAIFRHNGIRKLSARATADV